MILDDNDEALFVKHKKKTEKMMGIVVALLVSIFAFTLWFLLTND